MHILQRFEQFYSDFKSADLADLALLYEPEVTFRDPVHSVTGVEALGRYFAASRESVSECRFEFNERVANDSRCFYQWQMHYRHPKLDGGRLLTLRGVTRLTLGETRIIEHEDIYDMGAMLYEHVPILRSGVRWLKRRLQEG